MRNKLKQTIFIKQKGFTIIELLIVIAIIGILIGLSAAAYQGIRRSARDTTRKGNLEDIKSGLEIYRTDCGQYPASITFGGTLIATCGGSSNTYLSSIPRDPQNPTYLYRYFPVGSRYNLCAHLENGSTTAIDCDGVGGGETCGSGPCNYIISSP